MAVLVLGVLCGLPCVGLIVVGTLMPPSEPSDRRVVAEAEFYVARAYRPNKVTFPRSGRSIIGVGESTWLVMGVVGIRNAFNAEVFKDYSMILSWSDGDWTPVQLEVGDERIDY